MFLCIRLVVQWLAWLGSFRQSRFGRVISAGSQSIGAVSASVAFGQSARVGLGTTRSWQVDNQLREELEL